MKKNIIFCSGGTGGHIFPAISMINYFKDKSNVILVTDKRALKYIPSIECEIKVFNVSSFSKKKIFSNIFSLIKLFVTFLYSVYFILKKRTDIVFGFGGYVSFSILLAAKFLNRTIYLYEPNLVLGRTNKLFVNSCRKIFTTSNNIINIPKKNLSKFIEVGPIIRNEIIKFSREKKTLNNDEKTIIILGGSQGARIFGEIIPVAISTFCKNNFKIKVVQQVITNQIKKIENFYNEHNIQCKIFDFDSNIAELISKSDLAISRSGSSTIAELEFLQVPFIAIPYPFAMDNHQYENALYYKSKNTCWILEQKNFTSNNLSLLLLEIFNNNNDLKVKRKKMFYDRKTNTLDKIKKEILI